MSVAGGRSKERVASNPEIMVQPVPRKSVLIIEDDPDIREALAEILEDEGYATVLAGNGREALDHLAKSEMPALILLDLMMPIMDGWQFRDEQRRSPSYAAIPVVV